jgi:hypothetical protein
MLSINALTVTEAIAQANQRFSAPLQPRRRETLKNALIRIFSASALFQTAPLPKNSRL